MSRDDLRTVLMTKIIEDGSIKIRSSDIRLSLVDELVKKGILTVTHEHRMVVYATQATVYLYTVELIRKSSDKKTS